MALELNAVRKSLQEIEVKNRQQREQQRQQTQSSPAPAKPKHEYSTDSLSMLDMSGMGSTAMVNVLTDTAQDVTDYAKGSNAYYKYIASDEEKKREAKVISIETGIPVNALLASDENMAKGRSVQEYTKKRMALAPEGVNEFDMNDVYVKFPGLKDIVDNPSMTDNDVAIAMHNIEDLTKVKDEAEAFSLGYAADKANYRIGELGMMEFLGGEMTDEMKKEIASIKKSIPEQKSMPNFFDDPLTAIAGGTGANIYHMGAGAGRGLQYAAPTLLVGGAYSAASGVAAPAVMAATVSAAGTAFGLGMAEDMFLNSAGRHYYEYSEMKAKNGEALLTKDEARAFAAIAAGIETGVEFWNYGKVMSLLGVNYKREIMEIVAKASGDQAMLKSGLVGFLRMRSAQAAKAGMTEAAEEALQDVSDKAVHNTIVSYAPQSAHRKYTGTEFVKGALEASAEAMPGIIGLGMIGGAASSVKSVRDFAMLQKERSDIFYAEMKLSDGLSMLKNLQANMAESKLFKQNPEIYQAVVKSAVENTEFKEVRVDTELALQDEEGAAVFNQLVEEMGLEQEEVNAIIENKADLVVPTEIYAQTVMDNDKFDQYISFDEKGHSVARKKYYMAVAEDMAKSINLEQEEKQADLIDSIITANFPEAGIEQDMGAAIIMQNPSNPREAWRQMKRDIDAGINARLGDIVKKLEEGMSRGVHMHYDEEGYAVRRQSDNDKWYGDFYKQNKRKPNKRELLEMARDIYKGDGMKYGMMEYQFEATEDMQEDFASLDSAFDEMYALEDIKEKVDNLTASEMAVVQGLTPSGYKVYQTARKQFESGNADVQKAGRMNAILLARYADRMADNITKITGKPYTAEDYMRERTHIVPDATEVDEGGLEQAAAMRAENKRYVLNSNGDLDWGYIDGAVADDGTEIKKAPIRMQIGFQVGKDKAGNGYTHIIRRHSDFLKASGYDTVEKAFYDVLQNASFVVSDTMKTGQRLLLIKDMSPDTSIGLNLDYVNDESGEYYSVNSLVPRTTRQVKKRKKRALLFSGRQSPESITGDGADHTLARSISAGTPRGSLPRKSSAFGTISISEVDEWVNKFTYTGEEEYNQTAYHGSPHTFDSFDLGAIGTGEGAQVHGWGLYFAQDKKVARRYKTALAGRKKGALLEVDVPENNVLLDEQKAFSKQNDNVKALLRNTYAALSDAEKTRFFEKILAEQVKESRDVILARKEYRNISTRRRAFVSLRDKSSFVRLSAKANLKSLGYTEKQIQAFADDADLAAQEARKFNDAVKEAKEKLDKVALADKERINNVLDNALQNPQKTIEENTGEELYGTLTFALTGAAYDYRVTSTFLNEHGIKGITYDGRDDGRCFVVFDDKAISVIERYNQSVRGQTKISGISRVVSLFESADRSTFVHELGHVALADLKMLAEMEGAPAQLVKDWQTVKEWLGYKDSQGFTREQHEKFARGFEAYLRTGEAPVRGLRAVFRTFKKWLCDIYADFVQLGGKPSAEVQAVMARMIASEQEIEAEAKIQGIESITKKKGMKILDDTTQAMYERWVYEAKEEAKEKVLKIAMKDIGDDYAEQRQAVIDDMRKGIEDSLKQEDIFRAEECVRLSGSTAILPTLGYTEESYRKELEARGGSLKAAVEQELQDAVADLDSQQVSAEHIREEAEKALSSSKYKAMLLTLEYEAIARKEAEESRLDKSVDKALEDIEKDLRGEEGQPKGESAQVKSLKQKIADLKYTYRWREAEMKLINQMQKQAAEAEAKRDKEEAIEEAVGKAQAKAEQDREKMLDTVKALKESIASSKEGVRLVRDAVEGQMLLYKKAAKIRLALMPIRQATATYSWRHKERMKGSEVAELMAKGKWKEAKQAKLEQVMFSYFADESARMKADIEKNVKKLKKRSNSIAKGNVKLAADERYFYNHLLYVFGINRRDAIKPQEWQDDKSIKQMFKRYSDGHEVHFMGEDGEVDIPEFIVKAASGNDVYRTQVDIVGRKNPVAALGYGALTKDEWDGLYDILTSVYTIGKNANRLYTVVDENGNEVSFDDAVQRIADGIRKNVKIKKNDDVTGMTLPTMFEQIATMRNTAVGELIKPETIFRQNDGNEEGASMMFLYDPINRAAEKELRMQAETAKAVHELFAKYREHRKEERYKLGTSLLTKEQVIVLALNWGTEINRKRILDTYKKPDAENSDVLVNLTEKDIVEVFANLTAEDWQTVTGVWNLLESFWGDTVAIEERMTGVGLEKQQATPFDIVGKDGTVYHLAGGYYPIMYDPAKSGRQQDLEQDNSAKMQMSGNAVLGTRRGFTKQRSQETIERPIYTVLDPLQQALDDVIHNICYREAIRDVNKLINAKEVEKAITEAYGGSTYKSLQQWVRDNWAIDEKKDRLTKVAAFLRRNATLAVMGWRPSVAFLNVTSFLDAVEHIGAGRMLGSLWKFAQNPAKEYKFCLEKSAFLANRAETMDRDVREKLKEIRVGESKLPKIAGKAVRGAKGKVEWVEEHAFTMMAITDIMFSAPLWKSEYERAYREGVEKNLDPGVIEQKAIAAGDAAVRRVYGSGDVKDLAPVQRGNEIAKQLTMFYSYMNTVFNAFAYRYGRAVNAGEWMEFARFILYRLVLVKATEEVFRAMWGDDEEDMSERIKKVFDPAHMAQSFGEQVFGMIPIAREFFKVTVGVFMGDRVYGVKMTSAYDALDRAQRAAQSIMSSRKDWVDVGRDVTKVANSVTGLSDTFTDGFWTLMRVWDKDFDYEVGEVLKAIVFDKKLK